MTALHRCPRCNSSAWWFDREDQAVTAVCLMCGITLKLASAQSDIAEKVLYLGHHNRVGAAVLEAPRARTPEMEARMPVKSTRVLLTCASCGTIFKTYACRVGIRKYCSRPCLGAAQQRAAAEQFSARFRAKVNKDGPVPPHCPELGPCWLWTGNRRSAGYGQIGVGSVRDGTRRNDGAHRVAWREARGPIPEGLWVLHHCDNRPCVNPSHLFLGTIVDNTRDMNAKGRQSHGANHYSRLHPERIPRGEATGAAKLTARQVAEIRERWPAPGVSQSMLAREYGVCVETISNILRNRSWRVFIRDGRAEARDAELAAVRGHLKHGPKPKGAGDE